MTTRKVTKLLAVVALATSPTAADPTPVATPDPWATVAVVTIAQPPTFSLTRLVERLVAPRTMPSGSPACGNVASRAPQPADCVRRTR
ncbi:hypothetical protein BH11MYX3_BH11MYX3_34500 [soil metagenome]